MYRTLGSAVGGFAGCLPAIRRWR